METNYKPLIIALPVDFGPPIYYSPEDEFTLLLSQLLTAILAGIEDLDTDQIRFAMNEVKNFINRKWDRKAIYFGSGSAIILPSRFREKVDFINKLKDIFIEINIPLTIKFWDEFDFNYSIVVFGLDMRLRKEEGIKAFIEELRNNIELWNHKATEYLKAGLIVMDKADRYHDHMKKFSVETAPSYNK